MLVLPIVALVAIVLFFTQMKKPKTGLKRVLFSVGGLLLLAGAFCAVFGGFMPVPNGGYLIVASAIPLLISAILKSPETGEE